VPTGRLAATLMDSQPSAGRESDNGQLQGNPLFVKDIILTCVRWMKMALARDWLRQRAIVGREAAMRLLGRRALSGQASHWTEQAYDSLYPLYDPDLELIEPRERPCEMLAMHWDFWDERGRDWLQGIDATDWDHYLSSG
jgi:hypothetical protein